MINFYKYEDKLVKVVTTDDEVYIGYVRDIFDKEDTETEDECTIEITEVINGDRQLLHEEPVFGVSDIKSIEIIKK